MKITKENIFYQVKHGNYRVLDSPLVDKVYDELGNTPLHYIACITTSEKIIKKLLKHPSVDKVKCKYKGSFSAYINGQSFFTSYDITPAHMLYDRRMIVDELKEKYPWFRDTQGKTKNVDIDDIENAINMVNSVKFIREK